MDRFRVTCATVFERAAEQHVYIVRHGDKYSSYPDCGSVGPDGGDPGEPCYDPVIMGNNPPLTECGVRQAETTARWVQQELAAVGGVANIVSSPYTRCLQTALPLAKLQAAPRLHVEYLLSEDRQAEGPHAPYNAAADNITVTQLAEVNALWDLGYGSPPIPTPEDTRGYWRRVRWAARRLADRFPPASGHP
jgi:broad specificity phosphatase PhoE